MINVRRFPGVLFRHKGRFGVFLVVVSAGFFLFLRWHFVCTSNEIRREIDKLCQMYNAGDAVGNLCNPLCVDGEIHPASCISQHSKKPFVFTAKWNKRLMVMKSSQASTKRLKHPEETENIPKQSQKEMEEEAEDREEKELESTIRRMASEKLNITLTKAQLEELKSLESKNKLLRSEDPEKRKVERKNVFALLQSQEYLLSRLFSDRDLFPQILGTCGHFYGVEYLERPRYNSLFTLDDKAEWSERMKLAVAIMDFVEEMETNFPDALHLCDVQMNHLGVTTSGRIKFLDLDLVYMKNIIDKLLRSGRRCQEHRDCDFLDCKSFCNLKENVCDGGVVNDNLQAICEKIFIGWTMSEKTIVPGLLMSEYTPASLSALLRLCAENRREPVHEDLRQRLYTTLTEMHQILIQKFSTD